MDLQFPGALYWLMRETQPVTVGAEDAVLSVGETGTALYFVAKGECVAVDEEHRVAETFSTGSCFAEAILAVPTGAPHTFRLSVYARRSSELLCLSRAGFMRLTVICPAMMETFFDLLRPDEPKKFVRWLRLPEPWQKRFDEGQRAAGDGGRAERLLATARGETGVRSPKAGARGGAQVARMSDLARRRQSFNVLIKRQSSAGALSDERRSAQKRRGRQ
jgi:hypothetical protein